MSKKGPDLVLIGSITAACLIVAAAVIFAPALARKTGAGTPQPANAVISEALSVCKEGDTCILVDTSCGICCAHRAINQTQEDLFNEMFNEQCLEYKGEICGCADVPGVPRCVEGRCQVVKFNTAPPAPRPPEPQTIIQPVIPLQPAPAEPAQQSNQPEQAPGTQAPPSGFGDHAADDLNAPLPAQLPSEFLNEPFSNEP